MIDAPPPPLDGHVLERREMTPSFIRAHPDPGVSRDPDSYERRNPVPD